MSEKKNVNEHTAQEIEAAKIDDLDIEPLSDDLLDSVAGGISNASGCSCVSCAPK